MNDLHTCSKCYLDTGWHAIGDLQQSCFSELLADIDNPRIKFRFDKVTKRREVSCE